MKKCKVTRIIRTPEKVSLRLDHITVKYWSVAVVLSCEEEEYESNVTFETLEDAQNLKLGDVFWR